MKSTRKLFTLISIILLTFSNSVKITNKSKLSTSIKPFTLDNSWFTPILVWNAVVFVTLSVLSVLKLNLVSVSVLE